MFITLQRSPHCKRFTTLLYEMFGNERRTGLPILGNKPKKQANHEVIQFIADVTTVSSLLRSPRHVFSAATLCGYVSSTKRSWYVQTRASCVINIPTYAMILENLILNAPPSLRGYDSYQLLSRIKAYRCDSVWNSIPALGHRRRRYVHLRAWKQRTDLLAPAQYVLERPRTRDVTIIMTSGFFVMGGSSLYLLSNGEA